MKYLFKYIKEACLKVSVISNYGTRSKVDTFSYDILQSSNVKCSMECHKTNKEYIF